MNSEETKEPQDPAVVAKTIEMICAEDTDISTFRSWFQSGNGVPQDFTFSYNALKKLVGFPFPDEMLQEFDAFLIPLSKWGPETRFKHFYTWFYRPVINGQYAGMPMVMEKVRAQLARRPLWKKLIGFYP